MLAKLTSKNQLTLPKAVTEAIGPVEYFNVETRNGTIVLTPVRIQRGDAVRARLAELELTTGDIDDAVAWTRQRVAEPGAKYDPASTSKRPRNSKPARPKATRKSAGKS